MITTKFGRGVDPGTSAAIDGAAPKTADNATDVTTQEMFRRNVVISVDSENESGRHAMAAYYKNHQSLTLEETPTDQQR